MAFNRGISMNLIVSTFLRAMALIVALLSVSACDTEDPPPLGVELSTTNDTITSGSTGDVTVHVNGGVSRIEIYRLEQTRPQTPLVQGNDFSTQFSNSGEELTYSFVAPEVSTATEFEFTYFFQQFENDSEHTKALTITVTPTNLAPQIVMPGSASGDDLTPITITAQVTDDGSIASLVWSQTAGPSAVLTGVDSSTLQATAPIVASDTTLSFQLVATDDQGVSSNASIDVTVSHANRVPTISNVALSATDADGRHDLSVDHSDADNQPLTLTVEVSTDDGNSWRRANIAGDNGSGVAADNDGSTTLTWDALATLGFRTPTAALLRVTASDGSDNSAPVSTNAGTIDYLAAKLRRIDHHAIHYAALDTATSSLLKNYDLVILHPAAGNLQRIDIADIQGGSNPDLPGDDVMVLCYLLVGEDIRSAGGGPLDTGDGTGPRVDPRANPYDGGLAISGMNPLGAPSSSTTFASYYLDDNDAANGGTDGAPDINFITGRAYVNIGDPAWYAALNAMQIDIDGGTGLAEVLTLEQGRSLGCDGVFMDGVDTASPNILTDGASDFPLEFEWTAVGFADFTARIKANYPRAVLMQNNGLFYYDPRFAHYAVNARADIDLLLFDNYRLDSGTEVNFSEDRFADNKHQLIPKIMAEANRPDGFRVLSLGYAEGPGVANDTLVGLSTTGNDVLLADISEAMQVGLRHYLSNAAIDLVNDFVRDNVDLSDSLPPQWSSTFNDSNVTPLPESTPRIGLQALEASGNSLVLRWDVALDQNGVDYVAYHQTQPFDFNGTDPLAGATRQVLTSQVGAGYVNGVGQNSFAHQAQLDGLTSGQTYYVLLRAVDRSAAANEDSNEVVLNAVMP
jgi:hypothetical protein